MPTFEIPDGPTSIDASRSAEGSAVYSVTNRTSETVDGRLGVRVSGASRDEWFTVDGNRERTFGPGETQTATIRVRFPGDAPEGNYPFQLRAVAVNDPDNDHAEGPMTIARLGPGGGKKSLLWLWILLGLLAVAVIGGAGYYFLSQKEVAPPAPPAQPAKIDTAQALRLAEKKAAAWYAALSERNVDALVDLADPPFYLDNELLVSKSQIRDTYAKALARGVDEMKITKITPYTIGDLKKNPDWDPSGDRVMRTIKLGDEDIAVHVSVGGDDSLFFFRRTDQDVLMAGVWG